jgi:hypothetical protein
MTKGTYGGGIWGFPWGGGFGVYFDNHGRAYPQLYGGTPRLSLSGGYTPDLEGLLTGTSISGSPGAGNVRSNIAGNATTAGIGIGTPGVGVTYGFGPLEFSTDYSQPWRIPYIRESARAAGVPSRYNVWEYGYPESDGNASAQPIPGSDANSLAVTGLNPSNHPDSFESRFGDWPALPDIPPTPSLNRSDATLASQPGAAAALHGLARHFVDILMSRDGASLPLPPAPTVSDFQDRNDSATVDPNGYSRSSDVDRRRFLTRFVGDRTLSAIDTTAPPIQPGQFFETSSDNRESSDDAGARGRGVPFLDDYIRYLNQVNGT